MKTTLTEAKKLSASFNGNKTKYPTPGKERLIKIENDTRIYLQNKSGHLTVREERPTGLYHGFKNH